jgi:hypothetical protein
MEFISVKTIIRFILGVITHMAKLETNITKIIIITNYKKRKLD